MKKHTIIFPLFLVFMEMSVYLSNDMYLPAMPNIVHDLATTADFVQFTLTAWFLGSMSLQLILGPIADQVGRKPVLLFGSLLFIIASVVCAMAPTIWILILARFFQGMAVCTTIVAGYATVHELFDQKQAIRTMAWMGSIIVLAPALGPLFGGLVLQVGSWHSTFFILAVFAVIAGVGLLIIMPETLDKQTKQPYSLASVFKQYYAIITNRQYISYIAVFCFLFAGMIIWITGGPFLVMNFFKQSPLQFGIYTAIIFAAYILGTRLLSVALKFFKLTSIIRVSMLIIGLGCLLMILVVYLQPTNLSLFLAMFCIYTFGAGLVFSPLQRLAIDASQEPMGARVAMFSSLMTVASVLATLLVSCFYANSLSSLMWLIVLLGLICASIGLFSVIKIATDVAASN